jgi:hypothetical protein
VFAVPVRAVFPHPSIPSPPLRHVQHRSSTRPIFRARGDGGRNGRRALPGSRRGAGPDGLFGDQSRYRAARLPGQCPGKLGGGCVHRGASGRHAVVPHLVRIRLCRAGGGAGGRRRSRLGRSTGVFVPAARLPVRRRDRGPDSPVRLRGANGRGDDPVAGDRREPGDGRAPDDWGNRPGLWAGRGRPTDHSPACRPSARDARGGGAGRRPAGAGGGHRGTGRGLHRRLGRGGCRQRVGSSRSDVRAHGPARRAGRGRPVDGVFRAGRRRVLVRHKGRPD